MKADAQHLVISEISFSDGDKTVVVGNGSRKFRCDLSGAGVCSAVIAAGGEAGGGGTTGWPGSHCNRRFAGQDEGGVYSRLEPVGARPGYW